MPDAGPSGSQPPPLRGYFDPHIVKAIRAIHQEVWNEPYRPLRGPMHYAGGPYQRNHLLQLADQWERMARAARACAEVLPDA